MNHRTVKIFSGATFQVPERIQRLDSRATHGWQLRYGRGKTETEMFSDFSNDGSGAEESLRLAVAALHKRIERLPAPNGLKTQPASWKTTDLPVGVSGPIERNRKAGKTSYFAFQVSVPRIDGGSTTKSVYIGTANTATPEREEQAKEKAIAIRAEAVRKFEGAKTKDKREKAASAVAAK